MVLGGREIVLDLEISVRPIFELSCYNYAIIS